MTLGHSLEFVVVDSLSLAEGSTSKALVSRYTDHLVAVEDQITNAHVSLQLFLHFFDALLLNSDLKKVEAWLLR